MSNPATDRDDARGPGTRGPRTDAPTDVGRTMGGGSLGHAPAADVEADAPLRNNPPDASPDAGERRNDHGASERGGDPVMPDDGAALKTKI